MSKLSKFSKFLSLQDAAKLMSDLINEKVDAYHLFSLYEGEWISLFRSCHGELVKLKPMFDEKTHQDHIEDGRYFMEEDQSVAFGTCLGFYIPCQEVTINGISAYALRDSSGGFYAVRDMMTDEYLSPRLDVNEELTKFLALTVDIYDIAEKANKHSIPEKPEIKIILNDHCLCSDNEIYNFAPNETPIIHKAKDDKTQEIFPPSLRITVAALLEAATSQKKNHTQSSLIEFILERNKGVRGLSESSLQKHFSDSNAELARLRKDTQD
ncbi:MULTISPECIES: hypothetical protein [Pseudomonas syringae group]|uniref:hypothetical protein n=1 Tax=Pseudomonas syringae group TaxID=136849 RepID=UPI0006B47EF7|nr:MULTISPECIES: hypothetical protein [Pseudomonas syringae group]MCF5746623.1 hypothetical protein [Pseudomonas tremae]UQB36561.1 hypothetical protein I9H09_24225 [Pseudomonas tremae]